MHVVSLSASLLHDYVQVAGPEARSFLQGQLTCNLDRLDNAASLVGALCNLKGRVIADFRLLQQDPELIILQTSVGCGAAIIDTLSRYAVFSKVELSAVAGPAAVYGLISSSAETASAALRECLPELPGQDNEVIQHNGLTVIRVAGPNPRYEFWCQDDAALTALGRLDVMEETAEVESWIREDVLGGIYHVSTASSENYTPQLLNYDISGVIDFDKGCYTGQEVVARMFYRGKPKKRMYILSSSAALSLDSVITEGQSATAETVELLTVVGTESEPVGSFALGIVSTELAAAGGRLQLAGSELGVELLALPYGGKGEKAGK